MDTQIEINISDDRAYFYIALVIDRPEIYSELKSLRRGWKGIIKNSNLLSFMYLKSAQFAELDSEISYLVKKHKLPLPYRFVFLLVLFYWKVDSIILIETLRQAFGRSRRKAQRDNLLMQIDSVLLKIPLSKPIAYRFIRARQEIKRDRDWYWIWKQGTYKNYTEFTNGWNKQHEDCSCSEKSEGVCKNYVWDNNIIEQAVSRYKQTINAPLTLN